MMATKTMLVMQKENKNNRNNKSNKSNMNKSTDRYCSLGRLLKVA